MADLTKKIHQWEFHNLAGNGHHEKTTALHSQFCGRSLDGSGFEPTQCLSSKKLESSACLIARELSLSLSLSPSPGRRGLISLSRSVSVWLSCRASTGPCPVGGTPLQGLSPIFQHRHLPPTLSLSLSLSVACLLACLPGVWGQGSALPTACAVALRLSLSLLPHSQERANSCPPLARAHSVSLSLKPKSPNYTARNGQRSTQVCCWKLHWCEVDLTGSRASSFARGTQHKKSYYFHLNGQGSNSRARHSSRQATLS